MKVNFLSFTITATYKGDKKATWGDNWNNHRITVYNKTTKKRISFEFWASLAEPKIRTRRDCLSAFDCFLSDAMCGDQSFEDFCSDCGYDTDSRKAFSAWTACKKANKKLFTLTNQYFYSDIFKALESEGVR